MARPTKVYTVQEVRDRLADHPGWHLRDDGQLERTLTFANFAQAMQFANAVAHLAEVADHHPDLCLHGWKHLTITLMTHSEGGITDQDWALVAQIEALPRQV